MSPEVPPFNFFVYVQQNDDVKNFHFFVFLKIFQSLQRVPLQFFFQISQKNGCLKISKSPLLQFSALWDFWKWITFVLNVGFLRPNTLYPIFVFCKDRCFFFLSNLFPSKPPSIFTRNETFCEHKRLLKVFGTMRLTGDQKFFSKNFEKKFPQFSNFWKVFGWKWWVFCCFQLGRNGFRDLCVSPWFFLAL